MIFRRLGDLIARRNGIKGQFAEFAVINQLRLHAQAKADLLREITDNLPADFAFAEDRFIWSDKLTRQDSAGCVA